MERCLNRFLFFLLIGIFQSICPALTIAQWQPDPWDEKPRTSLALAKESEARVKQLAKDVHAGPCRCAPEVSVDWETFKVEKYKYLSFKVMEQAVLAMSNICADNKQRVCDNLKKIAIEFGNDWAWSFKEGDTLFLRVAIGKIPNPEDIENLLRKALRIPKKEAS